MTERRAIRLARSKRHVVVLEAAMIGTTGTETELDFRSTEEAITVKTPQQRLKTIALTLTPKQVRSLSPMITAFLSRLVSKARPPRTTDRRQGLRQ